MNLSVTAVLLEKRDESKGEDARVTRSITLTIPELGWDAIPFRPSALLEVMDLFQDNEKMIEAEDEEALEAWPQFAKALKNVAEPFYTSRKSLNWESFKAVMNEFAPIVEGLNLKESTSDPLLSAKRYAAKAIKVANANDEVDYHSVIRTELDKEIASLNEIYAKALSLTPSDFTSFIVEKATQNGTDEDGYAKLRSKKEVKAAAKASKTATKSPHGHMNAAVPKHQKSAAFNARGGSKR